MENPQELEKCPDCEGIGMVFKHFGFSEEESPEECQLCLGSGYISSQARKYYDKDKRDDLLEDSRD